jgi:hypothetical protein
MGSTTSRLLTSIRWLGSSNELQLQGDPANSISLMQRVRDVVLARSVKIRRDVGEDHGKDILAPQVYDHHDAAGDDCGGS